MPDLHTRAGPSLKGLRIGLLGGSFNPAHEGHRAISLHALKQLKLDQVWWLVSPQNPLKPSRGMAALAERLRRAQAVAHHPKIVVTGLESELGTRYTFDSLRMLKKRFPGVHFVWLMGADNLRQISRWHKGLDIFMLLPIAVFRRPSYASGRRSGKAAQRFENFWIPPNRAGNLARLTPPVWTVLDNRQNRLSATQIRQRR